MYSQEKQFSNLAKILSNYDRVIIDTCSLMDEGFPQFMDQLVGSKRYWKHGLQIITPKECIEELNQHAANTDWHYSDARIDAVRALHILKDAQRKYRLIHVAKRQQRKGDNFADPSILATATVLRIHYRILVITQDKSLAYDLERLNALGSQNGRFLATMRINNGGQLEGHSLGKLHFKDSKKQEAKNEKKPAVKAEQKPTPAAKPAEKQPVIATKPTQTKPTSEKKEAKPTESKALKPYYEYGATPTEAIIASAKHLNVLVRDPSVPYVKEIHGPSDITRDVLSSALPSSGLEKTGDKVTVSVKGLGIVIEKTERDFKATVSLEPQKTEEPKPSETKEPLKATKPKAPKTPKAKAPVKEKEPEVKEVAKKVSEPTPKKDEKEEEVKPTPKKKAPKAKTEPKKEAAELTAEPAPAKKPAAPKKTPLEKALTAEKRLSANVSNPNYPMDKKNKDIDAFIKLYDKLSEEEQKQIKLTKDFLLKQKESVLEAK